MNARLRPIIAWFLFAVVGSGCHAVEPLDLGPHAQPLAEMYPHLCHGHRRTLADAHPNRTHTHLEAAGSPHPDILNLEVAFRLAGVDNPTIQLAQEQVREASAGYLAARATLLPTAALGGNFRLHRGPLQPSQGHIPNVNSQSLYLGAGAGAWGSGTLTVPGVRLFAHLGDAAYEPLAARQRVAARGAGATAVRNSVLLELTAAYLELLGAEARHEVLKQGAADAAEVVRLATAHADAGQGRRADADRAAANADLVQHDAHRAAEEVAVASARLCRLLNLDPSHSLRTPGGALETVRLIPEDADPESLVAGALQTRPEIAARSAEIAEAQVRARQERVRPFLPTVSVGFSAGGFGGGLTDAPLSPLRGRTDFDVVAVWSARNLGFGNRGSVRQADATLGAAVAAYDQAVNQVRREVMEADAEARAAAMQMDTTKAALAAAEEGFDLERRRIRQGQGLPIETLDSLRQVIDARQDAIRAAIAFTTAQFRLYVATGGSPGSGGGTGSCRSGTTSE